MGNDGVRGMGRDGWRRVKTSRKEEDIGVMKKGCFGHERKRKCAQVGQRACPCWATCLPHLGKQLAQKRDKKDCREEGDERDGGQLILLAKDKVCGDMVTIGVRRWTLCSHGYQSSC